MKALKKGMMLLISSAMILGGVGCARNENTTSNESVQNEVTNKTSQEDGYPLTIIDSYNQEVTLDEEPMRIISVAPNITELIYALGAQDKLVGRTDYCDYPTEVSEVESIGALMTPDIEKMISLEPDLVITSTHFEPENAEKLEALDIPVIGLDEEYDVKGVYTIIETLGSALNKNEEAANILTDMQRTIKEVEDKVAGLEEPTVYYAISYGEYGDFSAPENTFIGQLIQMAGGKNIVPASDSWFYSLEALLEADPEIIIVRNGEKEKFMALEGYKNLTAVKEGHVYEIDNNLLDRQSNRNAEGVMALAKIIHPEVFVD